MATQSAPSRPQPTVFILNLDGEEMYEGLFDSIYSNLIDSLSSKYRIQRARKVAPAQKYLSNSENHPIAILVVDPGTIKPANNVVLKHLKQYVQAGGIAVFTASFSSFISPPDMNKFWKQQWGLNWKCGDYLRTDVHLNRAVHSLSTVNLPTAYSQKALFLKNVAPADSLYVPSSESETESLDGAPEPENQTQSPVAFTKLGFGWLGYLGDVNNESGSQEVVMEICRFASYIAGSN